MICIRSLSHSYMLLYKLEISKQVEIGGVLEPMFELFVSVRFFIS